MPVMVATFAKPEDITNPGFDGKVFRFPIALIDRDDIGTPRQPSKTKSFRIRAEVSRGRIQTWGLGQTDLIKVLFELAKEHLMTVLNSGKWTGGDLELVINTHTHKGPCPFDPTLIQEPSGAVVELDARRPIGFV
jgi:hypothetical protein